MVTSYCALPLGFLIDLLLGDPRALPHPVVLIGRVIAAGERLLRAAAPKTPRGEYLAGAVLAALVPALSWGVTYALLALCGGISVWLRFAAETLLCWQILAARSLKTESMKVFRALTAGDLEGARRAVSMIVGRDTARLDEAGITRAAVETVAENASDGVIAPMLFCALGGAPLGMLYKAINTLDSMVGYKNERYLYFGRVAARLDDAASYIPSRLAALLMVAASPLCGFSARGAWRIWRRDRRNHASPNSAQTESACAGALGVRLAGDAWYGGVPCRKPTIGDALRAVEPRDIARTCHLMYAASMLSLAVLLACKAAVILLLGGSVC